MTGYIAEMRKLVGHRTILQCAASILCVDAQGRFLLGKRTDNHLWGYSGGSVEIDDPAEENPGMLSADDTLPSALDQFLYRFHINVS